MHSMENMSVSELNDILVRLRHALGDEHIDLYQEYADLLVSGRSAHETSRLLVDANNELHDELSASRKRGRCRFQDMRKERERFTELIESLRDTQNDLHKTIYTLLDVITREQQENQTLRDRVYELTNQNRDTIL